MKISSLWAGVARGPPARRINLYNPTHSQHLLVAGNPKRANTQFVMPRRVFASIHRVSHGLPTKTTTAIWRREALGSRSLHMTRRTEILCKLVNFLSKRHYENKLKFLRNHFRGCLKQIFINSEESDDQFLEMDLLVCFHTCVVHSHFYSFQEFCRLVWKG